LLVTCEAEIKLLTVSVLLLIVVMTLVMCNVRVTLTFSWVSTMYKMGKCSQSLDLLTQAKFKLHYVAVQTARNVINTNRKKCWSTYQKVPHVTM